MSETLGNNSAEQLKSIVERVERIGDERDVLAADIRDIYAEAKGLGYDVRALRQIVRLRAEDPTKRAEREAILDTYMVALGLV